MQEILRILTVQFKILLFLKFFDNWKRNLEGSCVLSCGNLDPKSANHGHLRKCQSRLLLRGTELEVKETNNQAMSTWQSMDNHRLTPTSMSAPVLTATARISPRQVVVLLHWHFNQLLLAQTVRIFVFWQICPSQMKKKAYFKA